MQIETSGCSLVLVHKQYWKRALGGPVWTETGSFQLVLSFGFTEEEEEEEERVQR